MKPPSNEGKRACIYTSSAELVKRRAMARPYAPPCTVGPDVRDLARSLGHTPESWQASGHSFEPYSGAFRANPYVVIAPPPQVVAASAQPTKPVEAANLGRDGFLVAETVADATLRGWCTQIALGRPAARPLLVVGKSIWPAVTAALRPLHCYPTTYDRITLAELPDTPDGDLRFRERTFNARVVMVELHSIREAGSLNAKRLDNMLPHTSWALFVPTGELTELPFRERFTIVSWQDSHRHAALQPTATQPDRGAIHRLVEASHTRVGGDVGLGMSAGQRLGLEPTPYRDAAHAAMQIEAAAAARRIAAMAGTVRDTKRVKLAHFNRGAGVLMHNNAHKSSFDP